VVCLARLISFFNPNKNVPVENRQNFYHLYLDFGWIGVLTGSLLAFLSVYAARLGASGLQVGLISAIPATTNLLLAMPAGKWLQKKPIENGVVSSSLYYRSFYILLIFLPFLQRGKVELWLILLITLLLSIPNTAYAVGYNALFGEAVPVEWRSHVAGIRNAFYAIFLVITSIICGFILVNIKFPFGYQFVFGIGAIGAFFSSYHLSKIKIDRRVIINSNNINLNPLIASPVSVDRKTVPRRIYANLRMDILTKTYSKIIIFLLIFYLFIYLPAPLFTLYTVHNLNKSDWVISIGSAMFYIAMFAGSTINVALTEKLGFKNQTGIGMFLICLYPLLISISYSNSMYYLASFVGGATWAIVNGGVLNYLLENVPANDMHAHMAWYNIVLNAGILLGSLLGPLIGNGLGLFTAIIVFGIGRLLIGIVVLRWG
jgi:MFS family permease